MITEEQAAEIRKHYIKEMEKNGFGNVVVEALERIDEDSEIEIFQSKNKLSVMQMSERGRLLAFLEETIDIIGSLSNENYSSLLSKFNEFNKQSSLSILSIEVESDDNHTNFDLRMLPNYEILIESMKRIKLEIQEGN